MTYLEKVSTEERAAALAIAACLIKTGVSGVELTDEDMEKAHHTPISVTRMEDRLIVKVGDDGLDGWAD
jgi:hypothetical protein